MNSKVKRKLLILTLNALALIALLLIQDNRVDNLIQQTSKNTEFQEVTLKATLIIHNQLTYDLIAGICLVLVILNMIFYRKWVKSRKWILEPILILVTSYVLTFSFFTYRTFEIKNQMVEEKRMKE